MEQNAIRLDSAIHALHLNVAIFLFLVLITFFVKTVDYAKIMMTLVLNVVAAKVPLASFVSTLFGHATIPSVTMAVHVMKFWFNQAMDLFLRHFVNAKMDMVVHTANIIFVMASIVKMNMSVNLENAI